MAVKSRGERAGDGVMRLKVMALMDQGITDAWVIADTLGISRAAVYAHREKIEKGAGVRDRSTVVIGGVIRDVHYQAKPAEEQVLPLAVAQELALMALREWKADRDARVRYGARDLALDRAATRMLRAEVAEQRKQVDRLAG